MSTQSWDAAWPPRHPAHEHSLTPILPNLFLSALPPALSPSTLSTHGITHLLSLLTSGVPFHLLSLSPIVHKRLDLPDVPSTDLKTQLPSIVSWLSTALQLPDARVLVHCEHGVSRGPAVVIAYLMAKEEMTFREAIRYVQEKKTGDRRGVCINLGFVRQLSEWGRCCGGLEVLGGLYHTGGTETETEEEVEGLGEKEEVVMVMRRKRWSGGWKRWKRRGRWRVGGCTGGIF